MNNQTIVKGIICKDCGNELPEMTIEQHLNGDFNQNCPHSNDDEMLNFINKKFKYNYDYIGNEEDHIFYIPYDKESKNIIKLKNIVEKSKSYQWWMRDDYQSYKKYTIAINKKP
jgi:hypothetical protein